MTGKRHTVVDDYKAARANEPAPAGALARADLHLADMAIEQLEERVEEWAAVAIDCAEWAENEHEESIRRIALETRAERERDEAVHCESYMKDILHNMLKTHALLVNDLYRQIEYLKCCGNCNNFEIEHDSYGECDQSCSAMKSPTDTTEEKYFKHDWPMMDGRFGYCQPQDKCHWKVSRWKEWPF